MAVRGFNSDFIEELKTRCDIVSVISKYIPLEKKGKNYWGRCPFHHEKTPSFSVNSANQFYHCFGCSASGDVIRFVEVHESLDFLGAVKLLCDTCGLVMPQISVDSEKIAEEKKQKERLFSLNKDCAKFYYSALFSEQNKNALQYFNARGLSREIITRFGLGYSPDYESSVTYLKNLGYTFEEMEKAGIAAQKNGRFYDVLGGRLIFPILNGFSEVVGFSGRIFDKQGF
ncbi:MAG: CHC2 zinc finger domain-containing protein, partial [Firmicutes bacterium]|nr:CHC2 zinc finger domain-containing protein [Bacillota bacterium]